MTVSSFPRPEPFFDRGSELDALHRAWRKSKAGLALLYGRRRVGKTYLLQRFLSEVEGASGRCYYLADQSTAELQRLELARRLIRDFPAGLAAEEIAVSWNSVFRYFGARAKEGGVRKAVLVLDEFPYLVEQTPSLPSILQAWWDEEGAHLPALVILCGSQLSMMAALDHQTAPLHGRFNAGRLRLEPMSYLDVAAFYDRMPTYGPRERALMYGALGGTPRYHGEAEPHLAWDEQIIDLLLRRGAPFEDEARSLLTSEQIRDPAPFNAILLAVAKGATRHSDLINATGLSASTVSYPLGVLTSLGWLRKERPFGESGDRRSIYRIADPFLHFWFRFGMPLASERKTMDPETVFRRFVEPFLDDYMGLRIFEEICGQWLATEGHSALSQSIREIGRYWTRDGRVEIDQVARLADDGILFGECKWSVRAQVGVATYARLVAKVEALPNPEWRHHPRFILYSMGGFSEELRALAADLADLHLVDGPGLYERGGG